MERTHTITCRLAERDYAKLASEARAFGLNRSDYLRMLIRLPVTLVDKGAHADVLAVDNRALIMIERQLKRQGHLLNQGIRALNTIALKLDPDNPASENLRRLGEEATSGLSVASDMLTEIESDLRCVLDAEHVFLDIKRRKPK